MNTLRRSSRWPGKLLLLVLLTLLASCGAAEKPDVYCDTMSSGYCASLRTTTDGAVEATHSSRIAWRLDSSATEVFDVQALDALASGQASHWRPDYLTTAVIIIDRSQTDVVIKTWSDLPNSDVPVALIGERADIRMLVSAISWGLTSEQEPAAVANELLAEVRRGPGLTTTLAPGAVTLGLDHQVRELIRGGANLEVIIPSQGTLSFHKGLLSDQPIPASPGLAERLVALGYALPGHPPPGAPLHTLTGENHSDAWWADFRREVLGARLANTANSLEAVLVPAGALLILATWAGSMARRASTPSIRRATILIAALSAFWLVLRYLKYPMEHDRHTNLLWYAYYLPMLLLPLCLLWLAWAVDRPLDDGLPPRWIRWLAVVDAVLLAGMMTNDLHEWAFDIYYVGYDQFYHYRPLYYVVALACAIPLVTAIAWLTIKSLRTRGRRLAWLPAAIVAAILAYTVAYVVRVPFIYDTDLTMVTIMGGMGLLEATVRSRMLPMTSRYRELFAASTLDMHIVEATSGSELTTSGTVEQDANDDLVISRAPISGGQVVWQEDHSVVNTLQRELRLAVTRLQGMNLMLTDRQASERATLGAQVRASLLHQMEDEVGARVAEVGALIADLPPGPVDRRALARIALRICFVKRRAALFFQGLAREPTSADTMNRHFAELAELSEPTGLSCTVVVLGEPQAEVWYPGLLYECVFRVIDQGVLLGAKAVIGQVQLAGGRQILRLLLPADFGEFRFDAELRERLDALGAELVLREVDESHALSVTVPPPGQEPGHG